MKRNPHDVEVEMATRDIGDAVVAAMSRHALTRLETIQILTSEIQSLVKNGIRAERDTD